MVTLPSLIDPPAPQPEPPLRAARGMYRGYWHGGRRSARVTRLHVIRDTPIAHHGNPFHPVAREYTWCGQSAGRHRNSQPQVISPLPDRPPDGLAWCPACVGHLAEHYGLLTEVAASLAAYDPGMTQRGAESHGDGPGHGGIPGNRAQGRGGDRGAAGNRLSGSLRSAAGGTAHEIPAVSHGQIHP